MYNDINNIAVVAILKTIDKDILVKNVAEYLTNNINDDPLRIAAILANKLPKPTEISQHSKVYNKIGTFKTYNHFTGIIEYSYDDIEVLYFKTEQDAKAYSDKGIRRDYAYSKSDMYSFEAGKSCERTDYCNYELWLQNAINNETESD